MQVVQEKKLTYEQLKYSPFRKSIVQLSLSNFILLTFFYNSSRDGNICSPTISQDNVLSVIC